MALKLKPELERAALTQFLYRHTLWADRQPPFGVMRGRLQGFGTVDVNPAVALRHWVGFTEGLSLTDGFRFDERILLFKTGKSRDPRQWM